MSETNENADSPTVSSSGSYAAQLEREADALERTADHLAEDGLYAEAMTYRHQASQMRTKAKSAA